MTSDLAETVALYNRAVTAAASSEPGEAVALYGLALRHGPKPGLEFAIRMNLCTLLAAVPEIGPGVEELPESFGEHVSRLRRLLDGAAAELAEFGIPPSAAQQVCALERLVREMELAQRLLTKPVRSFVPVKQRRSEPLAHEDEVEPENPLFEAKRWSDSFFGDATILRSGAEILGRIEDGWLSADRVVRDPTGRVVARIKLAFLEEDVWHIEATDGKRIGRIRRAWLTRELVVEHADGREIGRLDRELFGRDLVRKS